MKDAKQIRQLRFYKNNVLAGDMIRTPKGCQIKFDAQFLKQSGLSHLTYFLPLQKEVLEYSGAT